MSTYTVVAGDTLGRIARTHGLSFNDLLTFNPEYRANPNDIRVGDVVQLKPAIIPAPPRPKTPKKESRARPAPGRGAEFDVPRGQITFDAEGMEGGLFHSRRIHVPGSSSGATIGRGYDMLHRSRDEIVADLCASGVAQDDAKSIARLRGLKGPMAEAEIARLELVDFQITPRQQKRLFLIAYDELAGDVKRICRKHDVEAKYGVTEWASLDPIIRDIVVDLRYRGDYTGGTREKVQPCVVRNDLEKLAELMSNELYWVRQRGVPNDRFRRRKEYVS